jgi:serine/alanine adding enzyme
VSDLVEVEPVAWDDLLDGLGLDDVYLRRRYLESASLLGQGRPVYLQLAGEDGAVVFGALVREADGEFVDVGTPMGYGGPVAAGANPPVGAFFDAYERWCAHTRVLATFTRFHPVLANQRLADGRWHLEHIGHSISWRIEGRAEELFHGLDAHHRRSVRKARGADVEITVEASPADLRGFVSLYEETMRRRNASSFYFFPEAYWRHLTTELGEALVRADAHVEDGELVASMLCLFSPGLSSPALLHYHLGASSERGQALGANHLLFLETAGWAARRGVSRFHLGGGVGGFEDSLYEFKRRFDPQGAVPAYLGKAVHDVETYRALSGSDDIDYAGYFPAYRRSG